MLGLFRRYPEPPTQLSYEPGSCDITFFLDKHVRLDQGLPLPLHSRRQCTACGNCRFLHPPRKKGKTTAVLVPERGTSLASHNQRLLLKGTWYVNAGISPLGYRRLLCPRTYAGRIQPRLGTIETSPLTSSRFSFIHNTRANRRLPEVPCCVAGSKPRLGRWDCLYHKEKNFWFSCLKKKFEKLVGFLKKNG